MIYKQVIWLSDLQILLLIVALIVVSIELVYILWRRKKRMRIRRAEKSETLSERAHNMITTLENISSSLQRQGVNTAPGNEMLREAKSMIAAGDYSSAMDMAETAKLTLLRAKREHETLGSAPPPPPGKETTVRQRSAPEPEYTHSEEKPEGGVTDLNKLPKNYMQAKFMLATVEDTINKKGLKSGEAVSHMEKGKRLFKEEDYSGALSYAIKAERLLDTETVLLIGEKPEEEPAEEEEVVEIEVIACPSCEAEVSEQDTFCRQCGTKLEFVTSCPKCEADVELGDKFCRQCGKKIS
jgi:ribosomal protein L40E